MYISDPLGDRKPWCCALWDAVCVGLSLQPFWRGIVRHYFVILIKFKQLKIMLHYPASDEKL